eukprot:2563260-Amphidinium_carterae.1
MTQIVLPESGATGAADSKGHTYRTASGEIFYDGGSALITGKGVNALPLNVKGRPQQCTNLCLLSSSKHAEGSHIYVG